MEMATLLMQLLVLTLKIDHVCIEILYPCAPN